MNIWKIFDRVAWGVILILSIFGFIIFSTTIHELSHKVDFEQLTPYKDYVCVLVLPDFSNWSSFLYGAAGFYYPVFNHTVGNEKDYNKIMTFTERKAYILDAIVFTIFAIILVYFIICRVGEHYELIRLRQCKDLNSLNNLNYIEEADKNGPE